MVPITTRQRRAHLLEAFPSLRLLKRFSFAQRDDQRTLEPDHATATSLENTKQLLLLPPGTTEHTRPPQRFGRPTPYRDPIHTLKYLNLTDKLLSREDADVALSLGVDASCSTTDTQLAVEAQKPNHLKKQVCIELA